MYDNFTLKKLKKNKKIEGYSWRIENPKKVVCLIHGIGEHAGRYDRVAVRFTQEGYAVLSMDLRGHGHSIGPRGHCAPRDDVLDDISELIRYSRRLYPNKGIVLYGHSMGGNIVLDYRSRGELCYLPTGYIISAPWIRLVKPISESLYDMLKLLAGVFPSLCVGSSVDEDILGNPSMVKPYNDDPMVHGRISLLCALEGINTGRALEDGTLIDNGTSAKIPTLLMHGTEDKVCDVKGSRIVASRLSRQGDNIEYIEWPGLYHEIHNGGGVSTGEEVLDEMVAFMGRIGD